MEFDVYHGRLCAFVRRSPALDAGLLLGVIDVFILARDVAARLCCVYI
jgi:hypothetical protein